MGAIDKALALKGLATISNDTYVYFEKKSSVVAYLWYKPTPSDKWMQFEMRRMVDAAIKQDVWRINNFRMGDLPGLTPGGFFASPLLPMENNIQWEYAIKIDTAPDYFSGYHGYEQVQLVNFFVDGKQFDFNAMAVDQMVTGKIIEIIQKTFCLDPTDTVTKVGEMNVRHIFTQDGLRVRGRFDWVAARTITVAYAGMLPAKRAATVGTTTCRFLDDPTIYDISVTPHSKPAKNTYGVSLWNSGDNFSTGVEFNDLAWFNNYAKSGNSGMWVTDSAPYNKVYPARVLLGQTEAVTNGTKWDFDFSYRFFY